ncbi:MAG TPA: hypothetical protein PKK74_06935 [Candidatus Methanoculleus thermohydrogenotrophicum]|jgi:hypothetical protein|nr:hypothetical protein [Candidatus Methanoculleus thermohydrogenotrophicum]NLM81067.1 hypothetical protein [Candidatus Methanoculleus thermohydrogenotrophicum]HOB18410.1 hypothetical protein [Candidatus Methanoculleus thermohydrogenotrophicum]HPZ38339.1 hypothetical protein [Candidatus Methanoculleus thermohydrogenotrophicum]HQC91707.1 hypothetical protein [Candidatus Methanoculleus thermohydrogenotrophicum]
MDEAAKKAFKSKFAMLTVMLNIIILCFAMGVFILFRFAPSSTLGLWIGIFLLAVGAIISVLFRKLYYQTKVWLHEQP